jgi:hypothetical protein
VWNDELFQIRQKNHLIKSDIEFLEGQLERLSEKIKQNQNPYGDEAEAEKIFNGWAEILKRPVSVEKFRSFFERNMDEWKKNHSHEGVARSLDGSEEVTSSRLDEKNIFQLTSTSFIQWLRSDIVSNLVRLFPILAMPAEIWFSYPIFEALSNGETLMASAGAIVYTLGIFTMGELSGKCIVRMRYHTISSDYKSSHKFTQHWRPIPIISGVVLLIFSIVGIYIGAALRQNAGDIIRIGREVVYLRTEIRNLEESMTKVLNGQNVSDLNKIREDIKSKNEKLEKILSDRDGLIRLINSPFSRSEGFLAVFVFGVFFIAAIARQVFDHDAIYEYSHAGRVLNELKSERLLKLLILEGANEVYGLLLHDLRRKQKTLEEKEKSMNLKVKETQLKEHHDNVTKAFRKDIESYVHNRNFAFMTVLLRIRNIDGDFKAEDEIAFAQEYVKRSRESK